MEENKWVIVIGGGLAGHSAAHTVLQHRGRVILLDKAAFCGGNSTKATSGINGAGTKVQKHLNIPDTPECFEQDTLKSAGQSARPSLIHALTYDSAPAVEWLQDSFDLKLDLVGQMGAHSYPRTHRGKERFPGMMITYRLMERFEDACNNYPEQARLFSKARALRLITNSSGHVIGVEYTQNNETKNVMGTVILATGGFGADFSSDSLLKQVEAQWKKLPMWRDIPNLPPLTSFPTTNGSNTTGDGIKMAVRIGAATADLPYVQVHPTGLVDPKFPNAKVKWLAAEALRGSGGLLINSDGQRFCNELGKRDYVTGQMLHRGVMHHYESIEQLANVVGTSAEILGMTFNAYNTAAASGEDSFGKKIFNNLPFDTRDTFHAAMVTPVVHYTMGGLACDAKGCVLDQNGDRIPGLFAAGEIIGGIHGDNRLGGSSLLDCVVFGRIAGLSATSYSEIADSHSIQPSSEQSITSPENIAIKKTDADVPYYTLEEVSRHNSESDCWVVLHGKVYDVTSFLEDHPGGAASIMAYAGKDATSPFDMLHSIDILKKYAENLIVGVIKDNNQKDTNVSMQNPSQGRVISLSEVSGHNSKDDCWCIIHGKVYDLTSFLPEHPGGASIIVKYAGKDATAAFDSSGHPQDIVSQLGLDHLYIGETEGESSNTITAKDLTRVETQIEGKPPLSQVLNLFEFEAVARKCMSQQGWAYYSSGSDDEITLRENHSAFHRLWLRPRILVDVSSIDLSSTMLGYPVAMPVYITSCALGRLAHPDGELCLTRAAGSKGVVQLWPTLASCTLDEMESVAARTQTIFLQLYVNHDRKVTERLLHRAKEKGVKAIFVTVDAPQLGRREKDMRVKFTMEAPDAQREDDSKGNVDRNQGTARAISQFIDPSLSWKDLDWLRGVTDLPLVLKGVQCADDALIAVERGLNGIVCSNHGGRQLDFARSGVEVLVEVMAALKAKGWEDRIEVYVDGGVRRGTDVLKALALGAKAVGIGRPTLYAMAGYGAAGVERVFDILHDEMTMGMRLLGAPGISDLKPAMVCTKALAQHISTVPKDHLTEYLYEPLNTMSKL